MFRDEEGTTLHEIIRKAVTAQADALDKKVIDHLTRDLFGDPRFMRWFKSHYDFHVAVDHTQTELKMPPPTGPAILPTLVGTRAYRFQGPTWIPFGERLKRRIVRVLRHYLGWAKIHDKRADDTEARLAWRLRSDGA